MRKWETKSSSFVLLLFISYIIFALLFSLPPSRNSDPGSHSRLFSPPSPLRSVPCLFIATRFQLFLTYKGVARNFARNIHIYTYIHIYYIYILYTRYIYTHWSWRRTHPASRKNKKLSLAHNKSRVPGTTTYTLKAELSRSFNITHPTEATCWCNHTDFCSLNL